MEIKDVFIAVGLSLFASIGAIAKWLSLKDETPQKSLLSEAAVAAFCGGLVFCVYGFLRPSMPEEFLFVAFFLAGFLGWLGAKGVDRLGQGVLKNTPLGTPENKTSDNKKED